MPNVELKIIPHRTQRYDTLGDWTYSTNGTLCIYASETNVAAYNWALLLHELVEAWLCRQNGITVEEVDAWDLNWSSDGEPGDHPQCPYHRPHQAATVIERLFLWMTGYDWEGYEAALDKVMEEKP
jgi:hypothetical protein